MPSHDVQEAVTELKATVYGVQAQGGLVRRVDKLEEQVDDHEKRLNVLSIKWLVLMLIAGAVGNAIGSTILQALVKTLTVLP